MTYLRIRNFWDYQNADAWKKAKANKGGHRHPAWCKLYVARDLELDAEKPMTRLVFYELLRLATVCNNAIPNDISTILNAISLPRKDVTQAIHRLLEVGWLCETASPRRSREPSRNFRAQKQIREEKRRDSVYMQSEPKDATANYVLSDFLVAKLLRVLTDRDEGTEAVIRAIAKQRRLPEAAFGVAMDAAQSESAVSPTAVAISVLKAYEREAA